MRDMHPLKALVGLMFGMAALPALAVVSDLYNSKDEHYKMMPRYPDSTFTPEAMAGESVR